MDGAHSTGRERSPSPAHSPYASDPADNNNLSQRTPPPTASSPYTFPKPSRAPSEGSDSTGHVSLAATSVMTLRNEEMEQFLQAETTEWEREVLPKKAKQEQEALLRVEATNRILIASDESIGRRTMQKSRVTMLEAAKGVEQKAAEGRAAAREVNGLSVPASRGKDASTSPLLTDTSISAAAGHEWRQMSASQRQPPQYGATASRLLMQPPPSKSAESDTPTLPLARGNGAAPLVVPTDGGGCMRRSVTTESHHSGDVSGREMRYASRFFWPLVVAPHPITCDTHDDHLTCPFEVSPQYYCYGLNSEVAALPSITVAEVEPLDVPEGVDLYAAAGKHMNDSGASASGSAVSSLQVPPLYVGLDSPVLCPSATTEWHQIVQLQRVWVATVLRQQLLFSLSWLLMSVLFVDTMVYGSLIDVFAATAADPSVYEPVNRYGRGAMLGAVEIGAAAAAALVAVVFLSGNLLLGRHGPRLLLLIGVATAITGTYLLMELGRHGELLPVLAAKGLSGAGKGLAFLALLIFSWVEVGVKAGTATSFQLALVSWLGVQLVVFAVLPMILGQWVTEREVMQRLPWLMAVSIPVVISVLLLQPADMRERAAAVNVSLLHRRFVVRASRHISLRFVWRVLTGSTLAAAVCVAALASTPLLTVTPTSKRDMDKAAGSKKTCNALLWVFASALLTVPVCLIPTTSAWLSRYLPPFSLPIPLAVLWAWHTVGWSSRATPLCGVPVWLLAVTGVVFAVVAGSLVRATANAGLTLPMRGPPSQWGEEETPHPLVAGGGDSSTPSGDHRRYTPAVVPPSWDSSLVPSTECTRLLPTAVGGGPPERGPSLRHLDGLERPSGAAAVAAVAALIIVSVAVSVCLALTATAALLSTVDATPRLQGGIPRGASSPESHGAALLLVTILCGTAALFGGLELLCVMLPGGPSIHHARSGGSVRACGSGLTCAPPPFQASMSTNDT